MQDMVLVHHGVKGMKWGVRRYQNMDGSLTAAGKRRQDRRNIRAELYGDRQREQNDVINRREQSKVRKATYRLDAAKAKGASDKRIAKLERRASDAKVHAEIIKKRNEDMVRRNVEYRKKSLKEKLIDPETWLVDKDVKNAQRAQEKIIEDAKKKYGSKQVSRIQRKDTAKAVGATLAAVGLITVSTILQTKQ